MDRSLDAILGAIDYEKRHIGSLQLERGVAPDASEATNNEMVLQLVDHAFGPAFIERIPQLHIDDSLRDGADGQKHCDDTEKNQEGVENPAGVAQGTYLFEADGGDGGQRFVEGVEQRVTFNESEACGSDAQRE